ncbi:MAG: tetratricopeptide repeat protein [Chloroflexi bacterium]|nr:tetratricopeptide repeat protein [Chloroflexota bacterium]
MGKGQRQGGRPRTEWLTERELEVARLIERGLSNGQIGAQLDLSKRTVDAHVAHILSKLGLRNRMEVAQWVVRRALTTPDAVLDREVAVTAIQRLTGTTDLRQAVSSLARPAVAISDNLPASINNFVGRDEEVRRLKSLLSRTRLVTLTGAGGVGKTRLSIEVASELQNEFGDGVWLIELAALSDTADIDAELALVLGLMDDPQVEARNRILVALRHKHALIILDNCEHLLALCSDFVFTILRNCAHVHVVATSREPLRVPGETLWRIPSLSLPTQADSTVSVERASRWGAVQLFVDRALAARPEFTLTPQNMPSVVDVCRRLDGIPLALELAAAQMRVLSVDEIAAKLDDRFRFLADRNSASSPRQRTLEATVDWSYYLLTAAQRTLFVRLAVFVGSFTAEAAAVVCGGYDRSDSVERDLQALADKSLVVVEVLDETTRYRLLETLRQYARQRLPETDLEQLRRRHANYYLSVVQVAQTKLSGPEQAVWLRSLEHDRENLTSALDESLRRSTPELAYGFIAALWRFWEQHGHLTEGRAYADEVLQTFSDLAPQLRAAVLHRSGVLAWRQGDFTTAEARLNDALALLTRGEADDSTIALVLVNLGNVAWERGDLGLAELRYQDSLEIRRRLVDSGRSEEQAGVASCLNNLGIVESDRGNFDKALDWHRKSLSIRRRIRHDAGIALSLQNFGEVELRRNHLVEAREYYAQSLRIFNQLQERLLIARNLDAFARIAEAEGDHYRAARLFGATAANSRTRVWNELIKRRTCLA